MSILRAVVGVPADDAWNREHARQLAVGFITPDLPPGSVPACCGSCAGAVRLDPGSDQIRRELASSGHEPYVVCLTCAIAFGLGRNETTDPGASAIERFAARLQRLRTDPGLRLYIEQVAEEADTTAREEGMPGTRVNGAPGGSGGHGDAFA